MRITVEKNEGHIEFSYQRDGEIFSHSLNMESDTVDDSVFKVAFFSRPWDSDTYSVLGLIISNDIKLFFEKNYSCEINCEVIDIKYDYSCDLEKDFYLAFSGGFDSVAAMALLPEKTKLFSVDFGERFSREKDFFDLFKPKTCHWNIRSIEKKFNERRDWRFLISPLLLNKTHPERVVSIATGTILEASPFWFSGIDRFKNRPLFSGGLGPGVNIFYPVVGLSEWGTAKIASVILSKDKLIKSLNSLAPMNSLKRFRKELFLSIVNSEKIPVNNGNVIKYIYGNSFTEDILALYFVWKLGFDWVKENYATNVPIGSIDLDMSFFERFNQNNNKWNDPLLSVYINNKVNQFGIKNYSDSDYINILVCNSFINSL